MSRPMPSRDEPSRVFADVRARVALPFADETPSALHASLVASLHPLCCVCGEPGARRLGHVEWPDGPVLCQAHADEVAFELRDGCVTDRVEYPAAFGAAVARLCATEDARVRAECEAAPDCYPCSGCVDCRPEPDDVRQSACAGAP